MRNLPVGAVILAILILAALLLVAPIAPLVIVLEGAYVAAVLAAAFGFGVWPVARWIGRERPGWMISVATGLGLGGVGFATLGLGVAGWLNAGTAWTLVGIGIAIGLGWTSTHPPNTSARATIADAGDSRHVAIGVRAVVTWLPIAIPLFVAALGATIPPGILWDDEARGYDVLEYHLQVPREYFEAGRVEFLPHNVYASFPQQVEILYLLLMHLKGGSIEAAITAQLLHASLAALAVVAIASRFRGSARIAAGLAAGATPWVAYTGCMAYVEGGLLLFTAIAAGLLLDALRADSGGRARLLLLAGVAAGLAGGCKYTGLALVAVAGGVVWFAFASGTLTARGKLFATFAAAAALAFAPWAARNFAFTGNPVYPFAYEWFGGRAWSPEQAGQWHEGHLPPAGERSITARVAIGAREWFGVVDHVAGRWKPSLFGFALTIAGLASLAAVRKCEVGFLLGWSLLIFGAWTATTHIPGRFAIPAIAPLAICAGLWVERGAAGTRWRPCVLWVAAAANAILLLGVLVGHAQRWERRTGVTLAAMVDAAEVIAAGNFVNASTPADAHVRIIGDAAVFYVRRRFKYAVTFCRDPWVEYCAAATPTESITWLRDHGETHVVFAWSEIERLRRTYGFPAHVTPGWVDGLVAAGGLHPLEEGPVGRRANEVFEVFIGVGVSAGPPEGSP